VARKSPGGGDVRVARMTARGAGEPARTDRSQRVMKAIFIMIKCEMGQAYRVAREAADTIPQLSELFSTSGQYDLLGKFYLDPDQDIGLFVTERVQSLTGVKDTYTLITFNAFSGGVG
jgi:DNA-binding Lrp family transcriptional regulator